jgi:hypothetical protein
MDRLLPKPLAGRATLRRSFCPDGAPTFLSASPRNPEPWQASEPAESPLPALAGTLFPSDGEREGGGEFHTNSSRPFQPKPRVRSSEPVPSKVSPTRMSALRSGCGSAKASPYRTGFGPESRHFYPPFFCQQLGSVRASFGFRASSFVISPCLPQPLTVSKLTS